MRCAISASTTCASAITLCSNRRWPASNWPPRRFPLCWWTANFRKSPVAAGGHLGEWIAGTWAAIGGLAAWRRARATGRGDHVDVSAFECVSITLNPFEPLHASLTGDRDHFMRDVYQRSVEVPSIEPALDGWVGFAMLSAQQWEDFTV